MVVTVVTLDLSRRDDAERVIDIQRRAYRVEADLIGFDGIPPLHESRAELQSQPLHWLGVRSNGQIVAALGYSLEEGLCDIDRLIVDPLHFGQGHASALIGALREHARITVSTGTANVPARRLYAKHGFRELGHVEIAPGVTVTRYERRIE